MARYSISIMNSKNTTKQIKVRSLEQILVLQKYRQMWLRIYTHFFQQKILFKTQPGMTLFNMKFQVQLFCELLKEE